MNAQVSTPTLKLPRLQHVLCALLLIAFALVFTSLVASLLVPDVVDLSLDDGRMTAALSILLGSLVTLFFATRP